jgi:hypothetical protein
LPALSTATPLGLSKRAALLIPFALPKLLAWPAIVVTTPLAGLPGTFGSTDGTEQRRTVLLSEQASSLTPAGVTFRIAWLNVSARCPDCPSLRPRNC